MNHLGQLFLFLVALYGVTLIIRSRRLAAHVKRDALDHVAQIQTNPQLTQTQKDILVLEWVKSLGRLQDMNSLFGDIVIGFVVIAELVMLALSFTF